MQTKIRIAAIIFNEKQEILMVKGHGYEELRSVGGKVEEGETHEECLTRELQEEVGLQLQSMKYITEANGPSPYHPTKNSHTIAYLCTASGTPIPDQEIEKIIRLSKADFENNIYKMIPQNTEILNYLIETDQW